MATCAEITDLSVPENAGEDSVSFLRLLIEDDKKNTRESIVHHSIKGKFAIRTQEWKLEFCPGSGGWTSPIDTEAFENGLPDRQLYNMKNDPYEKENVVMEHPEVVNELITLFEKCVDDGRTAPGGSASNDVDIDKYKVDYRS
jgi:hypothetical protein